MKKLFGARQRKLGIQIRNTGTILIGSTDKLKIGAPNQPLKRDAAISYRAP